MPLYLLSLACLTAPPKGELYEWGRKVSASPAKDSLPGKMEKSSPIGELAKPSGFG